MKNYLRVNQKLSPKYAPVDGGKYVKYVKRGRDGGMGSCISDHSIKV